MLVWNDIAKYTNDYKNGIKKLDDIVNDADKAQNNKLNYKKNKFKLHSSTDDYGLDDKITIRSMKFKTSNDLKDMFKNKSTPSNLLKGKVELSSGTQNVINMQNKMIPKIDHSYIDPGYYEHKLEGKTNKDLMLKELSSGKDFAKQYVAGLPKRTELLESISKSSPTSLTTTLPSSPSPTLSTSTRLNNLIDPNIGILDDETTTKKKKRGFGNRINQTLTIGSALPNNENISFEPDINNALNKIEKITQNKENKLLNKRSAFNALKTLKQQNIINDIENQNDENHKTVNDLKDKMKNIKENKSATTIQKTIRTKLAQQKYEHLNNENKTMGNEDDDSKIENKQFNNNNKIQGSFNSLIKDTDSIDPKTEFRHLPKDIQIVINKLSTDSNKKNYGSTKQIGNIRKEFQTLFKSSIKLLN